MKGFANASKTLA